MRTDYLKKKYSKQFENIETGVLNDIYMACKKSCLPDEKILKRIAYNAAAIAVFEFHKIIKKA